LLLAIIGLSGAILVHRDAWTMVPHKHDAVTRNADLVADSVRAALHDYAGRLEIITFASPGFGVDRLGFRGESGHVLVRWNSQWTRPELWLFDLHRDLFAGTQAKRSSASPGLPA